MDVADRPEKTDGNNAVVRSWLTERGEGSTGQVLKRPKTVVTFGLHMIGV